MAFIFFPHTTTTSGRQTAGQRYSLARHGFIFLPQRLSFFPAQHDNNWGFYFFPHGQTSWSFLFFLQPSNKQTIHSCTASSEGYFFPTSAVSLFPAQPQRTTDNPYMGEHSHRWTAPTEDFATKRTTDRQQSAKNSSNTEGTTLIRTGTVTGGHHRQGTSSRGRPQTDKVGLSTST